MLEHQKNNIPPHLRGYFYSQIIKILHENRHLTNFEAMFLGVSFGYNYAVDNNCKPDPDTQTHKIKKPSWIKKLFAFKSIILMLITLGCSTKPNVIKPETSVEVYKEPLSCGSDRDCWVGEKCTKKKRCVKE